jgi:hypothetical protein
VLACLDDLHPDVRFVVRPSGGGTGAPRRVVTLEHSGASLTACTMFVRSPKGRPIEGRGTLPDVTVPLSRHDLARERDPIAAAGLREAGLDGMRAEQMARFLALAASEEGNPDESR